MPHAVRETKGPSTSVLTETEEEASHDESSTHEESEPEQEVYINHTHPNAPQPVYTNMYMPYVEGPKMDWMVNNALYHRFLKWKLKCKNISEYELTALPEHQKCKKVITWSSDFGMDQYVSWGLSKDDMNLDTIWERFEDFCKLQPNEVHAWFDLLTIFHQVNKSVNKWYNVVQAQVNLAKYPPETVTILHHNIFWFFLHDEDFVSRTITEGSVDLDKFPARRFHQLAKKFKSSKATVQHIKHVAGDLQATQINLMRHQQTELPTNRHNKKRRPNSRPKMHQAPESSASNQVKKSYDNRKPHRAPDHCNKCGNSIHTQRFQWPAKKYQCKICNKYGHFSSLCYQKKTQVHHRNSHRNPKAHQLHEGPMYAQDSANHSYSKESSSDESFCLQLQAQSNHVEGKHIPNPAHLITNLAYHLKPHHTRNMYLWAWLDTCANMNIMPASIYQLVFKDLEMKKIKPHKMQISTYTANTVKIIGS